MSGPLRSKQGCWTCRLRKKKCDECRPHCSTCESLSITCYGFGPKPDWMDNGEKEKAVINSLKQTVKYTWRRKGTTQLLKQQDQTIRIAPKSSDSSMEIPSSSLGSSCQDDITPQSDSSISQEGVNIIRDVSDPIHSFKTGENSLAGSMLSISISESVLLMHYLDNVFPLQYPMYKPDIAQGGRGWLLALLLRTKPLYHAALALSAYHYRTIIFAKIRDPYRVADLVQQEKHLEICLTEFQQSIKSVNKFCQTTCPSNGLGIMASMVQLVLFETFAGQGNAWQIHLRAATGMYCRAHKDKLASLSLAEESRTILLDDLPLLDEEPVVREEVVIFRFLTAAIVWLDITSSITAGTVPRLLQYQFCVVAPNSQTKLEDIIGCKPWVMLQISRIAALYEQKTQAVQQGRFYCTGFEQTVDDISKEIQCGLTQGSLGECNISGRDSSTMLDTNSDPVTQVTRIFAYMASIYLHLVTHGYQKLEILDTTISGAMRVLQTEISAQLLPALISPLYIIGSVARQEDEQFFRTIFSSTPLVDPLFKHRERILSILEEIWRGRQTIPGFAWKDSLELTHDTLLL